MNIVFLGTPRIAMQCLEEILNSKHKVLAVITQQDKPVGRGKKIAFNPVKTLALEKNIPLHQFKSVSKEGVEIIKSLKPDCLVLVAYGQILSKEILDIALPLNLHPSLLPSLRGPSPIQTAILQGLTKTGLTVMKMEPTLDSGDILMQQEIEIEPQETSQTLFEKMGQNGGKLLVEALNQIESGNFKFTPQDHSKATFTSMLTKQNAALDFQNQTATEIVNKVRAYNPNPMAYFVVNDVKYKVFSAEVSKVESSKKAGEIISADRKNGLVFQTKQGAVEIIILGAPNGKAMNAKDFLNGNKII